MPLILLVKDCVSHINYCKKMKKYYPYNKLITVNKITSGVDSINSPIPITEEYINTWSSVYFRSVDIKYTDPQGLLYTTEFTIRWNQKTSLINSQYQIVYNNQTYSIKEVIETEPRQTLKIICIHYGS